MRVREQLSPGAVHADAASLHNVPAIGKLQRKIRVLLYKKHCHAGVAKGAHRAHHFGHHQRREAERGLVEQEQLRPGHQGAAEGEHLLLPARKRAGRLAAALPQDRKARHRLAEAALDFPPPGQQIRGRPQVFLDGQLGEHAASFGHMHESERDDAIGRQAGNRAAIEPDAAFSRPQQPTDRAQRCALSRAVGADHGDDLAALDFE